MILSGRFFYRKDAQGYISGNLFLRIIPRRMSKREGHENESHPQKEARTSPCPPFPARPFPPTKLDAGRKALQQIVPESVADACFSEILSLNFDVSPETFAPAFGGLKIPTHARAVTLPDQQGAMLETIPSGVGAAIHVIDADFHARGSGVCRGGADHSHAKILATLRRMLARIALGGTDDIDEARASPGSPGSLGRG